MFDQEQYRKIAKNTAVLGGAQIVQMLVTLIRTKVIAVLLGPSGMGVNTLILSAITTIQQLSSLGIFQSGVRDLSHIYSGGDAIRFAFLRKVFNRITLFSGILGLFVCFVLSPFLSEFSFGNRDYTWSFVAVSVTLLFMALQSGKTTILQATRNLRLIAKATIVGALINLVVTVPMFYYWHMDGIVPAIISGYLVFYVVNKYYEGQVAFAVVDAPTRAQIIANGKPILKLGVALMLSSLMMVTFTFLLNGFISRWGSLNDVGLFQAASAICMQSLVIINSTLASDYFPRLSAVHHDKDLLNSTMNRQTEVMLFVVTPISALLIAIAPFIIFILLSSEFETIVPLIQMMALALGFRLIWTILGFVILAKGDKRNYILYDVIIGNGSNFILNIIAYLFYGLNGLGVSYVVGSAFMVILLSVVLFKKYGVSLNRKIIVSFLIAFLITLLMYILSLVLTGISCYISLSLFVVVVVVSSMYQLNRRLGLLAAIKSKLEK